MKNKMILPSNCVEMNAEEMQYLQGGKTIPYNYLYSKKGMALIKAKSVRDAMQWSNISVTDLAAEIWFHAYAYYNAGGILAICSALGLSIASSFWGSLKDGIQVENGLDKALVDGTSIPRYMVYRSAYALALTNPAIG